MKRLSIGVGMERERWQDPTGRQGWLWVMVTPLVSYFAVFLGRSQAVCQQLLGDDFSGIVSSDCFSAYNWLESKGRQICWAHLKHDFTRIAERSGVSSELGRTLLAPTEAFEHWYRVRDGTLSRMELSKAVVPHSTTGAYSAVRRRSV